MRIRLLAGAFLVAVPLMFAWGAVSADAAPAWWAPVGLRGTALESVTASGATIEVRTASGATLRSTDRGAHFAPVPGNPAVAPPVAVSSGGYTWSISAAGLVQRSRNGEAAAADPGGPDLGAGAHLLAAPAALPGAVVAVARDGTVWRRAQTGGWQRSLLLLPQNLVQGVPVVTSVAAFTSPLSGSVYLGTGGYAVLVTTDGGDDWIRAGPGLPDSVSGLAADTQARAVYAATSGGLWVHVLRALPAPPVYSDRSLLVRWLGIGAVTLAASVLALLAMLWLQPGRGRT